MTKRLIELDLTRIDRVGKGSNPGSKVVLYKSERRGTAKATFEDLLSAAHVAMKDVPQFAYVENFDVDTSTAVYRDFEGVRLAQPLRRSGDTFETDGDPYPVVMEFRPVDKSAPTGAEEGEATVPINKDDLDEDVRAYLDEVEKERDDAVAKADEAAAEVDALKAAQDDDGEQVDEVDEFMKSAPEAVRKALEEAEAAKAEVAKMREEQETARFIGIAKSDFGAVGDEAQELGGLLQAAQSLGDDQYQTLVRTVKAAKAQSEKAMEQLAKSHGVNGTRFEGGNNIDSLLTIAKSIETERGVTAAQALSLARQENPALVAEYSEARSQRAGK